MELLFYCFLALTWVFAHAGVPLYLKDLELGGYKKLWKPVTKRKPTATGIEFGKLSRGSLLKLLAEFAQNAEDRLRSRSVRPHFTAEFANNQYTRPFIYPRFFKTN